MNAGRTSLEDAAACLDFPLRYSRRRGLLSGSGESSLLERDTFGIGRGGVPGGAGHDALRHEKGRPGRQHESPGCPSISGIIERRHPVPNGGSEQ